jgi:hypothetical protein
MNRKIWNYIHLENYFALYIHTCGRHSKLAQGWRVGRSNRREGEIFGVRPDQPRGPPRLLYNRYRVFLGRGVNVSGRGAETPLSSEFTNGLELYFRLHSESMH